MHLNRNGTGFPCWCGENAWRACFRTRRFGLLCCGSCGCYRTDPVPLQADGEASDFYTEYYSQQASQEPVETGRNGRAAASRFLRVVCRFPELSCVRQSTADIGCGEGHLCAELKNLGWPSVTGLDVSRSRIERARRIYPGIRFCDRPLEHAGIDACSLDLAVMDNVVEHLPAPAAVLRQVRQHVAPDGRLLVITPNMESGNYRLLGRHWTPELAPHVHIFLFTAASLKLLLWQSGFAVDALGSIHTPTRSWRRWMKMARSGQVKELVWSAMQESGNLFARAIRSGPMLFAVARPDSTRDWEMTER